MRQDINHIIEKFWAGTATDAEKQLLTKRLIEDEQVWKDELQRAYNQNLTNPDGPLSHQQAGRVLARLHRQIQGEAGVRTKLVFFRSWSTWAAAAVLLLVAGFGIYQYVQTTRPVPAIAHQRSSTRWTLMKKSNTSTTVMTIALADGSTLALQPGSTVSYYEPFGKARNISLIGTGLFTVAKDADHPFVVLANGFTTTAIGTQFRVRTTEKNQVSVQLIEGKVVVQATPASGLTMRAVYLTPGQEFTANTITKRVSIDAVDQQPAAPIRQPVAPPAPVAVPGLTFAKDPLDTVFAEVGKRYHVQIDYDPADVQGLSFSGTFASADSLQIVLGAVCTMNDLSYKQEAGKVTIRKSP